MTTIDAEAQRVREERLPQWVRTELARLRADLASAGRKLSEGPGDSDTFARPDSNAPRPLGRGTTIVFETEHGPIHAKNHGDVIRITGQAVRGYEALAVLPRSSNHVEIRLTEL